MNQERHTAWLHYADTHNLTPLERDAAETDFKSGWDAANHNRNV